MIYRTRSTDMPDPNQRSRVDLMESAILALALFTLTGCASIDWTPTDTKREVGWQLLNMKDWSQTYQIHDDPDIYETNRFIGKDADHGKVNAWMAGIAVGHYLISRALPPNKRLSWQWGTIIFTGALVKHNEDL